MCCSVLGSINFEDNNSNYETNDVQKETEKVEEPPENSSNSTYLEECSNFDINEQSIEQVTNDDESICKKIAPTRDGIDFAPLVLKFQGIFRFDFFFNLKCYFRN